MLKSTHSPRPGDAIRILADKFEARAGDIAVLDGIVRDLKPDDVQMICFRFSAYRDPGDKPEYVSASGGPAWYITVGELIPTDETISLSFWRFKGSIQRAGNDEEYTLEVPLWNYRP
jgi:hypothetical protein